MNRLPSSGSTTAESQSVRPTQLYFPYVSDIELNTVEAISEQRTAKGPNTTTPDGVDCS